MSNSREVCVFRRVSEFIFYSSLFLSLCAAGAAYQTLLLVGVADWGYVAFVCCATFVFYNLQRVVLSKDYTSPFHSDRHRWILKQRKLLTWLSIGAFVLALPFAFVWSVRFILIFSIYCVVSTFYFIPQINLRRIPFVKASFVSLLWAFSTAIFPLLLHAGDAGTSSRYILTAGLERFLFILPLCLVFNIRDLAVDLFTGTKTMAIVFGVRATRFISSGVIVCFMALVLLRSGSLGGVSPLGHQYECALLLSGLLSAIVLMFADVTRSEWYYLVVVDGMIQLQAALCASQSVLRIG